MNTAFLLHKYKIVLPCLERDCIGVEWIFAQLVHIKITFYLLRHYDE